MWIALLLVLLAISWAGCYSLYTRQRRDLAVLGRAHEKIQIEERRVFDFLHGLGAALSDSSRPADLHVLIVEGALRILEAGGGALYISDRKGEQLRPAFISRSCPPFFSVSEAQQQQQGFSWQSYLRLRNIGVSDGLLGEAWQSSEPILLNAPDPRLLPVRSASLTASTAMIGPLVYGGEKLGLLAIARGAGEEPFGAPEFQIFKTIVEQSAFALYNAIIFSEAAEKRRLDQDLQIAHEIQRILLPASAPELEGYQISGINIPAQQVSGDYYDYIAIDEDHIGVAIADVSGKGVPASLIMAMCRSVLRSHAPAQRSPAMALRQVNAQLFPDIKEDMFISMAYAILDKHTATLTLCRAGHDAPLLFKASDQSVSRINPPGMAVGIDSGGVFNRVTGDFSLTLEPNDCLVLYTDGVTEALNSAGDEFGMERVIRSIRASAAEGAAGIITRLTDDLRAFVGTYPQHDDITLIVIRKK
jgi:sigma-B regulation protein RsbU (phosphoserine phosphatase)